MLCIINYQYTHNQAKLCQNFQFFHIYITLTSFSVNMHHFPVEKPRISVEITEISLGIHRNFVFEFKSPFRSEIAKSAEISAEIPFPVIGGILRKTERLTLITINCTLPYSIRFSFPKRTKRFFFADNKKVCF